MAVPLLEQNSGDANPAKKLEMCNYLCQGYNGGGLA